MDKHWDTVTDSDGRPISAATVTVTNSETASAATIYTSLGASLGSSTTTDTTGYYEFYAPDGTYDISASKSGYDTSYRTRVKITGSRTLATVATLRAVETDTLISNDTVYVVSNGRYYWDSTSAGVDDGLTIIKPTGYTSNGRWLLAGNSLSSISSTDISTFSRTVLNDTTSNAWLTTITATRSEAGATAVPVLTKFREIASVKDFGATGDGVTDDETSFTNADATGKLVFIPKPVTSYNFATTYQATAGAFFPEPSATWAQIFDGGNLNLNRGFSTSAGNGANIWRFSDRVFVGEAASKFAGNSLATDSGTSWFSAETAGVSDYPRYLGINANLLVTSPSGKYGVVSAVRNSDNAVGSTQVIGFGSAPINDKATGNAWAYIAEIQHTTGSSSYGMEIAAKNASASANNPKTPYTLAGGVFGLWCVGGGDNAFGPASTRASNTALVVLKNSQSWQRGIVFTNDGIDGTDGSAASATNGVAINLARRHLIQWNEPTTDTMGASITSTVTVSTGRMQQVFANNIVNFVGAAGTNALNLTDVASAVNYLSISNAATGTSVLMQADGTDASVNIRIIPKGTGNVRITNTMVPHTDDGAALGTTALKWSDLFLASGGVINFDNGDVTLTHSANTLAFAGASSGYTHDALVSSTASVTAHSGTAIPAGGTAGAGLLVSSTANFGVFFGSGAPTLSAGKGSLYLRSDGTTTNNRAYINTDGAATWTSLTTAA